MNTPLATVREIGEKRLIEEVVRPLFNPENDPAGVGDDCAVISTIRPDEEILVSTDRVPADLIALRHSVIDIRGFGRHLAALNLSDIAACGGRAVALLLNCAMPPDFLVRDFVSFCEGVLDAAQPVGCRIIGGDISSSEELSMSATVIGAGSRGQSLLRSGARPGDLVFISRPIGLTPAAFASLGREQQHELTTDEVNMLRGQLADLTPMIELGRTLASCGYCTACMDNTDGLGQTLHELSAASGIGVELRADLLHVPPVVERIADTLRIDPIEFALGAGHDFSLVGALNLHTPADVLAVLSSSGIAIVGAFQAEPGVRVRSGDQNQSITAAGWNYFSAAERGAIEYGRDDVGG